MTVDADFQKRDSEKERFKSPVIPGRNNALPKSYWTNHAMLIMIWPVPSRLT